MLVGVASGPWLLLLTVVAILLAARIALSSLLAPKEPKDSSRRGLSGRRMSFLSASLFAGLFETSSLFHVVSGIWYFHRCPSREVVLQALRDRILVKRNFRRFWSVARSKPSNLLGAEFAEIPLHKFDVEAHVIDASVEDEDEIRAYVEATLNVPMDASIPLWNIHRLECRNGQSALLFRVHHAIGDGLALMMVMNTMLTSPDECGGAILPHKPRRRTGNLAQQLAASAIAVARAFVKIVNLNLVADTPTKLTFAPEFFEPTHSSFGYPAPLVWEQQRSLVFSPFVSIAFLKAAKNAIDESVTINDVLFSSLGGALRRYFERVHPAVLDDPHLMLRALVPFAFLPDPNADLGNHWSTLSVALQVSIATDSPVQRVKATSTQLQALKRSPEGGLQMLLQQLMGMVMPLSVQRNAIIRLLRRHSIAFTNVRGPQQRMLLGEEYEVTAMRSLVPNAIPQITVVSFNGKLSMSLVSDEAVVARPKLLIEMFLDELKALGTAVGLAEANLLVPPT